MKDVHCYKVHLTGKFIIGLSITQQAFKKCLIKQIESLFFTIFTQFKMRIERLSILTSNLIVSLMKGTVSNELLMPIASPV